MNVRFLKARTNCCRAITYVRQPGHHLQLYPLQTHTRTKYATGDTETVKTCVVINKSSCGRAIQSSMDREKSKKTKIFTIYRRSGDFVLALNNSRKQSDYYPAYNLYMYFMVCLLRLGFRTTQPSAMAATAALENAPTELDKF